VRTQGWFHWKRGPLPENGTGGTLIESE